MHQGYTLELRVLALQTELYYDYLKVNDEPPLSGSPLSEVKVYAGLRGNVSVAFVSDEIVSAAGTKVMYSFIRDPSPPSPPGSPPPPPKTNKKKTVGGLAV